MKSKLAVAAGCVLLAGLAVADDADIRFGEIKRIEANYEKAVADIEADAKRRMGDAEDARLDGYRKIYERIKGSKDVDRIVAVRDKIKALEEEAESGKPRPKQRLVVVAAFYGVNQSWNDVTDALQKKIAKRGKVSFVVADEDWGDPAPNFPTGNTLVVRYISNGKVAHKSVYQSQVMELP